MFINLDDDGYPKISSKMLIALHKYRLKFQRLSRNIVHNFEYWLLKVMDIQKYCQFAVVHKSEQMCYNPFYELQFN